MPAATPIPTAFARREIEYGVAVPLALADDYVLNTGTVDEAIDRLDGIVKDDLCKN